MIITHAHAKACGYCNRGLRRWFRRWKLDFDAFRKHGLDEREFLQTGDPMARKLVDYARNIIDG